MAELNCTCYYDPAVTPDHLWGSFGFCLCARPRSLILGHAVNFLRTRRGMDPYEITAENGLDQVIATLGPHPCVGPGNEGPIACACTDPIIGPPPLRHRRPRIFTILDPYSGLPEKFMYPPGMPQEHIGVTVSPAHLAREIEACLDNRLARVAAEAQLVIATAATAVMAAASVDADGLGNGDEGYQESYDCSDPEPSDSSSSDDNDGDSGYEGDSNSDTDSDVSFCCIGCRAWPTRLSRDDLDTPSIFRMGPDFAQFNNSQGGLTDAGPSNSPIGQGENIADPSHGFFYHHGLFYAPIDNQGLVYAAVYPGDLANLPVNPDEIIHLTGPYNVVVDDLVDHGNTLASLAVLEQLLFNMSDDDTDDGQAGNDYNMDANDVHEHDDGGEGANDIGRAL